MVAPACELHQLLAGERLARVLREHADQRVLARREVRDPARDGERARREVEAMPAERDDAGLVGRARSGPQRVPAQHRMDARDQLARIERLAEVVVGAHLEADDPVDVLALRRQHDDRDVFAGAAQPPADREPVLAGQHQVEHDEARRVALQPLVELARVGNRAHLEALAREVAVEEVAQPDVVVDDQDAGSVALRLRTHRRPRGGRGIARAHSGIGTHRAAVARTRAVTDCNDGALPQRPVAPAAARRETLGAFCYRSS